MNQHKVVTIRCAFCGNYVPRDDISMGGYCYECAEMGKTEPDPEFIEEQKCLATS